MPHPRSELVNLVIAWAVRYQDFCAMKIQPQSSNLVFQTAGFKPSKNLMHHWKLRIVSVSDSRRIAFTWMYLGTTLLRRALEHIGSE